MRIDELLKNRNQLSREKILLYYKEGEKYFDFKGNEINWNEIISHPCAVELEPEDMNL